MSYGDLCRWLVPEIIVVATALVVVLLDLGVLRPLPNRVRMRAGAVLTLVGCGAAIWRLVHLGDWTARFGDDALVIDPLTQFLKVILLVLTVVAGWISTESDFTEHVGEYFLLLLLATVGMMFLVSAENLLMIFVALELLSLSLYILTAFNKRNLASAEAALKYFLFGGMSAAFLLFGLSLIYGLTGSLQLEKIGVALQPVRLDPLLFVAVLLTVAGFGFKIAAVPFHLWAPDAYEGAPVASAAFIASGSKVASFFILAKVLMRGLAGAQGSGWGERLVPGWVWLLVLVAVASMVFGNLAAIAQRSVRRLLAYSAVAHAGYALLGVLSNSGRGLTALLFYVTTYALTVLGAFGVVAVVQERIGEEKFSAFAGLGRRAPVVAFCMLIFLLSLAGIPPLAGFFGKFFVFTVAAGAKGDLDWLWLVVVAVGMSAVSIYYYLQVLKQIYVVEPPALAPALKIHPGTQCVLVLLALSVIALGCAPNLLLGKLLLAVQAAGF